MAARSPPPTAHQPALLDLPPELLELAASWLEGERATMASARLACRALRRAVDESCVFVQVGGEHGLCALPALLGTRSRATADLAHTHMRTCTRS